MNWYLYLLIAAIVVNAIFLLTIFLYRKHKADETKGAFYGCFMSVLITPSIGLLLSVIVGPFITRYTNNERERNNRELLSSKYVYMDINNEWHLKKSCCADIYDSNGEKIEYRIDSLKISDIKSWEEFEKDNKLCYSCFYHYNVIDTLKSKQH